MAAVIESNPGADPDALLELSGIVVDFGGVRALDMLDMHVGVAEVVGVIGPNGAGKSTTLNVISGFVSPTRGTVRFDGVAIERRAPHRRARLGIARTFQTAQPFARLTVAENVGVAADQRRRAGAAWSTVAAILEACGVAHLADVPAEQLTGGQRRFAELARCLALAPRLILLDEPASGLRDAEIDRLTAVITGLRHDHGISSLIVSHDMRLINDACSRVLVLDHGAPMAHGTASEIRRDPRVIAAYLGDSEQS